MNFSGGGTIGYKWLTGTSNEGGASLPGGFTKNFRYDCYVDAASVGRILAVFEFAHRFTVFAQSGFFDFALVPPYDFNFYV